MPKPIPVEVLPGAGLKIGDVFTVEARHDRNVIGGLGSEALV